MVSRDATPPKAPAPPSIPLQNLSRPPDELSSGRRSANRSDGHDSRHSHNRSVLGISIRPSQYARLEEESPSYPPTQPGPSQRYEPFRRSFDITQVGHEEVEDPGLFASASIGLGLESPTQGLAPSTPLPSGRTRRPTIVTTPADDDHLREHPFTPMDSDTTPLTGSNLHPSSKNSSSVKGQRHDRQSGRSSVRWNDEESPTHIRGRSSRLGDDLPVLNTTLGVHRKPSATSGISRLGSLSVESGERSRSLSPAMSPLARAGSMLRQASQRVVNLSNDSDMVGQSIKRKSTVRHARPSVATTDEEGGGVPEDILDHEEHVPTPTEKVPPVQTRPEELEPPTPAPVPNPLRGKTWWTFGPESRVRRFLCEVLVHPVTEPAILVLIVAQTVLLAVNAASNATYHAAQQNKWGDSGFDWAFLGLFIIYTFEIIARTIVSGMFYNPVEFSTLDRSIPWRQALLKKGRGFFSMENEIASTKGVSTTPAYPMDLDDGPLDPSIVRTLTGLPEISLAGHGRQLQRVRLARRAFLRHSFNRLDLIAVVSYWISFGMQIGQYEVGRHVYIFNMLSCLRILRLLGLTSGTSIILRSFKRAAPFLVNVAFLICFFWLIFGIVGVQSFKSSLRRTCVYLGDTINGNYTWDVAPENVQFCGGYLNATTGDPWPWLNADGTNGSNSYKGYLCPQNSVCVQGNNPYNGTVSFDNIFNSLELVFVTMTSNTFSDLLYYLTDTDYLVAALFFAAAIVVLTLWLLNLLIAVITSSFQIIREESKQSAFTAANIDEHPDHEAGKPKKTSQLKQYFDKTKVFWILLIVYDLVVQCLRSASMGPDRENFIMDTESVITLLLLAEIAIRCVCDWRQFFSKTNNLVDLFLAIVTAVTQIPVIRNSGKPYAWLTAFQIARIYRVILAVRVTRELIMVVFGNVIGILNLIVFVFLLTFLTSILASQLFRGDIPPGDAAGNVIYVTFFNIWNSFLGMYQVFSSENWTTLMYNATQFDLMWDTAWLAAMFFIMWFILANFIVLNMFIAVIQESFDVSEDEKRLQQVKAFLRQKEINSGVSGNLSLTSIFRFGRDSMRHRDALEYGAATLEQLLKEAVVKDFLDETEDIAVNRPPSMHLSDLPSATAVVQPTVLSKVWRKIPILGQQAAPNPFYSDHIVERANEEFDASAMAKQVLTATENRRRAQRAYLVQHPNYNVSLRIFKPSNPIRKACQYLVGPGRGGADRIEGVSPYKPAWYTFSAFIYASVIAMVLLACVTTPLYQREYYQTHSLSLLNWFLWIDLGFAILFTIEAVIKVVADGFFFTPHAYFHSVWGAIDGIVLITLWINVITSMFRDDGVSRTVAAFKALRALRLLNISDSARETFYSVIIIGFYKILSAAFVSLSLLIPFAILGLNLFNGEMQICNDQGFGYGSPLSQCVGEFNSTPFSNNWTVLAPHKVTNPYYDFDNFGDALFILFQIVSQEGWIDVMNSAVSITNKGLQPRPFASQGNAVYFVIFNLLGAVFILTLFVSVFMRNWTEQTGVAFLTADQRSWLELRKLLRQISPSKKSLGENASRLAKWCYRVSVKRHGKWHRFITWLLLAHLTLLVIEFYPEPQWWVVLREWIFLIFTLIFMANVVIRIIGLSWRRFRRSTWDLYSIFVVTGTLVTSIMRLASLSNDGFDQLQKLFLVSITFLLIPRNNSLDQLFKTAAASLPAISNLLATWFVLFLVFAIAFTQALGLTRFGPNENGNLNFRNVPKALILLFRMSMGEGWNQIMEDFSVIRPPFCVRDDDFFQSDCGSSAWARALFIAWNLISMYIFVSLFVSLIFENFSYVYQQSSGLARVSRDEIRRFKHAWSDFDPHGTGWISKEKFPRLLGELSGVFQMRIYEGDYTVQSLKEDCTVEPGQPLTSHDRVVDGLDLDRLNERLNEIPVEEIRAKRARMEVFYQEVMLSSDPDRGISFTSCLMILAHYNVITDSKSLRLEEFLRRRARLQRVHDTIRRNTVIRFLDMIHLRHKFRKAMNTRKSRLDAPPVLAVPEIFIENPDDSVESSESTEPRDFTLSTPTPSARKVSPTLPKLDTTISQASGGSWSPGPERSPGASPIGSPRRLDSMDTSYYGATRLSPATPTHSRQASTVSALSTHAVMESFDASAWGESIRRSFTTKRTSNNTRSQG